MYGDMLLHLNLLPTRKDQSLLSSLQTVDNQLLMADRPRSLPEAEILPSRYHHQQHKLPKYLDRIPLSPTHLLLFEVTAILHITPVRRLDCMDPHDEESRLSCGPSSRHTTPISPSNTNHTSQHKAAPLIFHKQSSIEDLILPALLIEVLQVCRVPWR